MKRAYRIAVLAMSFFLLTGSAAFAQADTGSDYAVFFSGAIGAAITIIGAGWGIGRIGSAAVESMARQPEVAGQIQTAMLIAAALIEGATFFALVVCIIQGAPWPTAG